MVLAAKRREIKAGTRFTPELFDKVFDLPRRMDRGVLRRARSPRRSRTFDRAKAPVIMELLKRQLLSPRYIQHSARVLFVVGQASSSDRAQIMDAIFDLSRDEIVRRLRAGSLREIALAAHDYALDVFDG